MWCGADFVQCSAEMYLNDAAATVRHDSMTFLCRTFSICTSSSENLHIRIYHISFLRIHKFLYAQIVASPNFLRCKSSSANSRPQIFVHKSTSVVREVSINHLQHCKYLHIS